LIENNSFESLSVTIGPKQHNMYKIWDVGKKDSLHVPGPMWVLQSPPITCITGNINFDTHLD